VDKSGIEKVSNRLDIYVTNVLTPISRAGASKIIEMGKVLVNGQAERKSGFMLKLTDKVVINYDPDELIKIENIDLPVIYEDDTAVVINKPVGLLSHSKGAFNPEATVATWLAMRAKNMTGDRAGIVHRLDRLTSGVMICAKTDEALKFFQKQFSTRKVKKTYMAIVEGSLKQAEAVIDMPIERNPKKPQTFRAGANGKSALTAYKVIKESDKYSLLELKPTTGRTHQLRVHLSQIGHPILGDVMYGGKAADRMYLHALSLELTLMNKERETFTASLPSAFNKIFKS
jgi:23S rRNA pseudouridine1911/1915/1917 synthase